MPPRMRHPVSGERRHPYWPDWTDDEGDAVAELFDDICGDCVEGRCHFGGEMSRRSIAAVKAGREYVDPQWGACGCSLHRASAASRPYHRETTLETALAWRAAKESGAVVAERD